MDEEYCKSIIVVDLDTETDTSTIFSDLDTSTDSLESSSYSSLNANDLECYVIEEEIWTSEPISICELPKPTFTSEYSKPIPISEVNFETQCTEWYIKALVTNKSNVGSYSNYFSEGTWFDLELCDGSSAIRAVVFGKSCDIFHNLLKVNKTYYFSNCKIKLANKKFQKSISHNYELVLEKYSRVKPCEDNPSITAEMEIERPVIQTTTLLERALDRQAKTEKSAFHVEATILEIKNHIDEVVYKACPLDHCKKKVERTKDADEYYFCPKCDEKYPTFKYRYMLKVLIADWTRVQWITLFDLAESFLNISARDIVEMYEKGTDYAKYESYFKNRLHQNHTFILDGGTAIYHDENRVNGVGSCFYPIDFKQSSRKLVKELKRLKK